jgi:hypothetical protein
MKDFEYDGYLNRIFFYRLFYLLVHKLSVAIKKED